MPPRKPSQPADDDFLPPKALTLPDTLDATHGALLREHHFETAGTVAEVLGDDDYEGVRVLYAVTNPTRTALVYVGDSEIGRDLYGRLKDHLSRRAKAGQIEPDSLVFVHVMVTEYLVLCRFEEETGALPLLNNVKSQKNKRRGMRLNGVERLIEEEQIAARHVRERAERAREQEKTEREELKAERKRARKWKLPREIVLLNPPKGSPVPDVKELTLKQERKRWKRARRKHKREGGLFRKPAKGSPAAEECIRLFGRRRKVAHIVLLN